MDRTRALQMLDELRAWVAARGEGPVAGPPPSAPPAASATPVLAGVNTAGWRRTFYEPFDVLDWSRWDSIFNHSDPSEAGCTLLDNGERQWYPNHRLLGGLGAPWVMRDGKLSLRARPLTQAERASVGYVRPELNTVGKHEYLSGLLSSHRSFAQQYGYFRIRCKMPAGRGLWPAFWAKAQSGDWPPEIDFFEVLGHEPNRLYTTIHFKPGDTTSHIEAWVDTTQWHDYGVLWRPDALTLYVDGKEAGGGRIPNRINEPMHLLLNLAVGGSWPEQTGPVDPSALPAEFVVDEIEVWQF